MDSLVETKQISDWLTSNPKTMDKLVEKHSKYHLIHYTQRMHLKLLKKRGKLPKTLQLSAARATVRPSASPVTPDETTATLRKTTPPAAVRFSSGSAGRFPSGSVSRFQGGNTNIRDKKMALSKKKEALLKYELLTDLQNQLTTVLLTQCRTVAIKDADLSHVESLKLETDISRRGATTARAPAPAEPTKVYINELPNPAGADNEGSQKRKRNPIIVTPAWCYSEASGTLRNEQNSSSHSDSARSFNIWKGHVNPRFPQRATKENILLCLGGRESGASWSQACSYGGYAGRNCERWTPFLEGLNSPAVQFEGPAVHAVRRSYRSWCPTSCAYMSSAPSAQPHDRQGVRKVLDVKFHPEGLPQLVSSSNEAPNQLLLFSLISGRAIQLRGHNTKDLLISNGHVTVASRNPNGRVGVYYDRLDVYAAYKYQQVTLAASLPPVYQGHGDVDVWSPVLSGPSVPFAPYLADALSKDVAAGYLILQVKIDGRVRWKAGTWISGHYHLFVTCPAFLVTGGGNGVPGANGFRFQTPTYCRVEV